ncbi:MAG: hypothetical protein KDC13_02880 [Bacteroidetes bacterium]|nr:hypothetical protein [Bacteroidota bacterium]
MSLVKLWLSVFLLGVAGFANAQLSVTNVTGFENPVDYSFIGGNLYLQVTVYNSDDTPETEDVTIMYLTDQMELNASPAEELIQQTYMDIPGMSSVNYSVPAFNVNTEQFRVGGNIVVIWPSYSHPPDDSLLVNVTVNDTLTAAYSKFFSEPEARSQVLKMLHQNLPLVPGIEKVEVYDTRGRLLRTYSGDAIEGPADLPGGILFVKVYTTAGTYFSFGTRACEQGSFEEKP